MSVADDLKTIFDKMPQAFVPEKASNLNAIIQLNLSGDDGGQWQLKISGGQVNIVAGEAAAPDLTLGMPASDYVALTKGEANPMNLFMAGKIQVAGNMTLAMKFQELFDPSRVQ